LDGVLGFAVDEISTLKNLGDSGDVDAFIQHDRRDDLYSEIGPLLTLVIGVVASNYLSLDRILGSISPKPLLRPVPHILYTVLELFLLEYLGF